ncbi:tetratricopeptide repeat protein [Tenacibaculum sp. IB213877]|uniref:tetratricopeptide repeat protein n=1 Tax=Tenacibaculum sp. IB213877 TaxID=3097351 RepID=UPI002A5B0A5E|nr:tetratricopeptide repeat protein [Tenacibaculum sp. IB213877]MDY0780185.1 tetratricopeptide repeat protein [Tenacibaculum sp. IB213877]
MKLKPIQQSLTLLLCGFWLLNSWAQQTEIQSNFDAKFHHAITLYNNKAYAGAQKLFAEVSKSSGKHNNLKTDADYYEAMCAIKLNQTNADDKVMTFVKNNPYSSKKEMAFMNVGNYYFSNRKASHALKWYQKADPNLLSIEDRNELNYKMGYALLVSNYLTSAKEKFATLLGDPRYGNDARYYYGYISYKQENFGEAEDNLAQLADDATYKSKANYYLLDIAFKGGKFEKAILIGEKILPTAEKKQISDISKVIGESYFNLGQYEKAIPYLLEYKGKKGRWNNTDYYYLGYAYYKKEDYENAVAYFTKIIGGQNMVSQNAYYHLGECYLKTGKKAEALNAFKNASEMDFDPQITADADFNYAKLSYEEGNPYKSVPQVLKEYLAKYPESPKKQEISDLLITSYLYQQDYQGAIDYLQTNQNTENDVLANEISLYRGIQLFNQQKLEQANPHFLIATKAENDTIKNKARYWMAETDYLLGEYQNSLDEFLSVNNHSIEEAKNLNYNIAYSYFKLKNYESAATFFKKFLDQQLDDNDLNDDASNRLGDSYYATKNYSQAINAYEKVINEGGVGADYALYQKAMSNGLAGNNQAKIKDLQSLANNYETSNLKDDALFQLASTYTTMNKTSKANETYNKLLQNHPSSNYVPNVLLRQGLLYYNGGKNTQALNKFKEVVAKYPNSNEAKQAVTNARNVYVDIGKVDEYASWVKNVHFVNVSNSDIDNASYEAAENKFLDGSTDLAIDGFNKYLNEFPNGLHALKAHFYLAQSYFKKNQKEKTIPHYSYVVEQGKNEFSEESLAKLSQIYLESNNWTNAMLLLERLEKEANYPQNIIFAQSNMMKGYYQQANYEKAVEYAEKVLTNAKIDQVVEEDAKIIIARSAIKTHDYLTAEEYYSIVNETATGELKAEALYYNAYFLHEAKAYEDSNKEVQNLIANYSNYKYWGVKSYIIMAKNYYALKDAYQATYILENIIKNFTQFKDLVEEAQNELSNIKNNEAKTNESVNTQK